MAKSLIPKNPDPKKAWTRLYNSTDAIYKNRNNVTLKDVSNLMSQIQSVLDANMVLKSSKEEDDLAARAKKLRSIFIPIHTQLCNQMEPADWTALGTFLESAKRFT